MNRVLRGALSLVVAGGLAAGSAVFATDWLHDHRAEQVAAQAEPLLPENRVDRVVHALEGVADDGVYVAPDARAMLDEAGERKVAKAIARAETGLAGASFYDLTQQLEAGLGDTGDHGVYFVWEGPEEGTIDLFGPMSGYLSMSPHDAFAGDPAVTLPKLIEQADAEVDWRGRGKTNDYWGGRGGGIAAGALIGLGVLAGIGAVYGVLVWLTKRRLPGSWLW